jgi:hypothetical protein
MNGLRSTRRANPGALRQISQTTSIQGIRMASGKRNGEAGMVGMVACEIGGGSEA